MILLILVQWPEIIVTNANWNLMLIKHLISFIIVWWPEKIITYANWNLILIKYLILFYLNSFLLQKIPAMETLTLDKFWGILRSHDDTQGVWFNLLMKSYF